MPNSFSVLVVEDDPVDYQLLQRSLRSETTFQLDNAQSLEDALDKLNSRSFDVVVLDLSLPDSSGLPTVEAITKTVATPVVVLSGAQDEDTALKAVKHGAQDYLFKSNMNPLLLARTLRYAVERNRLLSELHETRERSRREKEILRLQLDAGLDPDQKAADEGSSQASLKSEHPKVFSAAVEQYIELLTHELARREYKSKEVKVSRQLKTLANRLGEHKSTPVDAIQIHTVSVGMTLDSIAPQKNALFHQEARYLLSGLMGHLCYFYMQKAGESRSQGTEAGMLS